MANIDITAQALTHEPTASVSLREESEQLAEEVVVEAGKEENGSRATTESGEGVSPEESKVGDKIEEVLETSKDENLSSAIVETGPAPVPASIPSGPVVSTAAAWPTTTTTTATPTATATVKRFSTVNINKRFLEKTGASSSSGTSGGVSLSNAASKLNTVTARPTQHLAPTPSRLVTAKLSSALNPAPTMGWSRPTSGAHSPANGIIGSNAVASSSSGLSVPPRGRSRSASGSGMSERDHSSSPAFGLNQHQRAAWGKFGANSGGPGLDGLQNEFPTAAEAAIGRQTKLLQQQMANQIAAQAVAAQKQAMLQTADSFRGVHLDPNAHHWDEMEDEDDEDFLGDVIDFGDGRQYKIQVEEEMQLEGAAPHTPIIDQEREGGSESPSTAISRLELARASSPQHAPMQVVTKAQRFTEDIPRSWSRNQPPSGPKLMTETERPSSSASASTRGSGPMGAAHSPEQAPQRALFNERSNKFEPWGNRPPTHGPLGPSPFGSSVKRDVNGIKSESPETKIQVLQKLPGSKEAPPSRAWDKPLVSGPPPSFATAVNRPTPRQMPEQGREKSLEGAPRPSRLSFSSSVASPLSPGQATSPSMPTVPPHSRELPKLSLPERLQSSLPSAHSRTSSASAGFVGPATDHAPESALEQTMQIQSEMADAAERAKKRRMEEEAKHEAQRERARKKAAELEEKMKLLDLQKKEVVENTPVKPAGQGPISAPPIGDPQPWSRQPSNPQRPRPQGQRVGEGFVRPPQRSTSSIQTPATAISTGVERGPNQPPPSERQNSWRTSAAPLPPRPQRVPSLGPSKGRISTDQQGSLKLKTDVPPPTPQISLLSDASTLDLLNLVADAPADVIDFADLGKFVGAPSLPPKSPIEPANMPQTAVTEEVPKRRPRPTAGDFFDVPPDQQQRDTAVEEKDDSMSWRRKAPARPTQILEDSEKDPSRTAGHERNSVQSDVAAVVIDTLPNGDVHLYSDPAKPHPSSGSAGGHIHVRQLSVESSDGLASRRTSVVESIKAEVSLPAAPVRPQWTERSMTALDDTMSRIKGALNGLHARDTITELKVTSVPLPPKPLESPLPSKPTYGTQGYRHGRTMSTDTLQPAQSFQPRPARRESFETGVEPPRSPKPAWNTYRVRIPQDLREPREPLSKKQRNYFHIPYGTTNWDIVSFSPVEGLAKRDLNRDGVLFQRFGKTKFKNRVEFPRRKLCNPRVDRRMAEAPKPLSALRPKMVAAPTETAQYRVSLPPKALQIDKRPHISGSLNKGKPSEEMSWRKGTSHPLIPDAREVDLASLDTTSRSPPPDLPLSGDVFIVKTEFLSPDDQLMSKRKKAEPKLPPGASLGFAASRETAASQAESAVSFTVISELDTSLALHTPNQVGMSQVSEIATQSEASQSKDIPSGKAIEPPSISTSLQKTPEKLGSTGLPSVPSTPWGKSPLAFSVLESSSKPVVDSDVLKAVWNKSADKSDLPSSNSLKGIADDLTAIPFTLQDVKSEDGSTPPPQIGPIAPPSRVDVARAFQQVPQSPAAPAQSTTFPIAQSPPQVRPPMPSVHGSNTSIPSLPPYGIPLGHSPSPTMMYPHLAPVQAMWSPAPAPGRPGSFVRAPSHAQYFVPAVPGAHPQYIPYTPSPQHVQMYHGSPPQPGTHMQASPGRGMTMMSPVGSRPATQGQPPASPAHVFGATPTPMPFGVAPARSPYDPSQPAYHPQMQQGHTQPPNSLYSSVPATSFVRPW